jgi:PAS domain S-box-containing protein
MTTSQPTEAKSARLMRPLRSPMLAVGGLLLGLTLGVGLADLWAALSPVARVAAGAVVVAAGLALWRHWQHQMRLEAIEHDLQQERLQRLERRAYQLDEAEHLVDVGSFDWFPRTDELHWSEQHFRLWGYEPGMVQPSLALFQQHLHPDDAETVSQELQRALSGEQRYDCVHRVLRADGTVRTVHARGEVFFDAQGQANRMIGAVLDITERVAAADAQRVYAFVLDAITDPVSAIDSNETYRLANRAWLEMNRRTLDESLGRTVSDLFEVEVSPERRQAVTASLAGQHGLSVRALSPSAGNQGRRIETRYFPFQDPAVSWRGAVMITRDVTEDEAIREALTASVDNLRLTLNTVGDAIFATDAAGPDEPVLFANDQLLALWNIELAPGQPLTARVIVDHAVRLFLDPQGEAARVQAIIAANLDTDDRVELKDGRVLMRRSRAAFTSARPVRVWSFRDITAEEVAVRSLADAEARQRTLLGAFPGFIWVIDDEERLVYLNPPAAAVYHPRVPKPGVDIVQLFGSLVADRVRPLIRRALAGDVQSMEWHRKSSSGRSPDDLLLKVVPGSSPDGRRLCYAFGIDISALKRTQSALEAARDEAERANQAKTQFLSSMSHELRTPLNAVIGFSQVLEQNNERNLTDRQVRQLGEIRRAGNHLLELINDLLDLARIEAGRTTLALEPLPLADLADESLRLVQPLAVHHGRVLMPPAGGPVDVLADRMRLKQVLLNLLSNAIKYNRDGGRVHLTWRLDGEQVLIEVRDEGEGLSPQAQARLFQPFERLDADSGNTVGTGIGLSLSRELVHLMQGEIGVRSVVGEGSCFWVRLPVAARPALPEVFESARLLYVDDNPVNLALMEGLFEEHPALHLTTTADPTAVETLLQQQPVDLLLVDLQMPVMDGFQLMSHVSARAMAAPLPVIAVSADSTPQTRERCEAMGFFGHVSKPVDADELFATVGRALQQVRAAQAPGRATPPT